MKRAVFLCLLTCSLSLLSVGCQSTYAPLAVVERVDLERYAGKWFEIASFPQRFQRGCVATTATYEIMGPNEVRVLNECRDGSFDGELRSIEGSAWVTNAEESSAKLKVQFFWPFSGDYWVIDLADDYSYAVVGHPSRKYLWILARSRRMATPTLEALRQRIAAQGYDLDALKITPQPAP